MPEDQRPEELTYAEAGVDNAVEEEAGRILHSFAVRTWENRIGQVGRSYVYVEEMAGIEGIVIGGLPEDTPLIPQADGIGSKAEIANALQRYDTIGHDIVAMTADDCARNGIEPVMLVTIVAVNSLGRDLDSPNSRLRFIEQLGKGLLAPAAEAGVVVKGGEIAQHGGGDQFELQWYGFAAGIRQPERIITGAAVQPGDAIFALKEPGFRSNGLRLAQTVFERVHGANWHSAPVGGSHRSLGELALQPSRIYTPVIMDMIGRFYDNGPPPVEIHGMAHITGGGIPKKLGRALRASGLGARLDAPLPPSPVMLYCQHSGLFSDREAYNTFNMGHGMLIMAPAREEEKMIHIAGRRGQSLRKIGEVTNGREIIIRNQGFFHGNSTWLEFAA